MHKNISQITQQQSKVDVSTLPKDAQHSVRRLNYLAAEIGAEEYLEIGVNTGVTLFNVCINNKTGVDPKFMFDLEEAQKIHTNVELSEVTSDTFFETQPIDKTYDLMFIDGLHTFEQTYRDVCNAILHSHPRTVLVIDDVKPNDVFSAIPDQTLAVKRRNESGKIGRQWHGDVFKLIFALHDFHPGLSYRTIVGSGNPQALVWRTKSPGREPLFNSMEQISRMSYFDMLDNQHILRIVKEEVALQACLEDLGFAD